MTSCYPKAEEMDSQMNGTYLSEKPGNVIPAKVGTGCPPGYSRFLDAWVPSGV